MPNLNLTKLVTNQDTFGEMVEKLNSNFDIVSQAQGLRGEEGKRGSAGVPGPPGAIGTQGAQGSSGQAGSRWYFGDSFPSFDKIGTNVGDFFLEADTGDVYEKISTISAIPWINRGSITSSGGGGGSSLFDSFIPSVNDKTKIIKPIKTNFTLEISDVTGTSPSFTVEPFSAIGADTAEFVLGGSSTTQNWLQEMGLKIYTSEGDTLSSIYGDGKNIHLANSTAFVYNKLFGWQNQSGFTLTVNWGGVGNRHEERLKISSVPSGDSNHNQIIDLTANEIEFNSDLTKVNSPFVLYSVDKSTLTPPVANGTLVYDTVENAVYARENNSWVQLSTTGGGGGGYFFDIARTFDELGDSKGIDLVADTTTSVFRIKEGNGITIEQVGVNDGFDALEIRLSSYTSTATDYYGTARVFDEDGVNKFSLAATGNDILEIQEGDNISITQNGSKIKINATASGSGGGSGSGVFEGFKYKWGQQGGTKRPFNTTPNAYANIIVANNGTLEMTRNLEFNTSEINMPTYGVVYPTPERQQTAFKPGKLGYWQFNVFAHGLTELPDDFTTEGYLYPTTVAGCILKNGIQSSYISVGESSTISPVGLLGINVPTGAATFPYPTWTINCSDILYLTDTDIITVGIGGLFAPRIDPPDYDYIPGTQISLWYLSGYISAVYLGI